MTNIRGSAAKNSSSLQGAPPALPLRTVHGVVKGEAGSPVGGHIVRAYDVRVRSKTRVGRDVTTGMDGRYEIQYRSPARARGSSSSSLNLVVEVRNAAGVVVGVSLPRFNARADEQIDVQVEQPNATESEYDRILALVQPRLLCAGAGGRDLILSELTDAEVGFLAREIAQPPMQLQALVSAARVAAEAEALPAPALYAWFRADASMSLRALWARGTTRLIAELESAITQRIVPGNIRRQLPKIRKAVEFGVAQADLGEPIAAGSSSRQEILETSAAWRLLAPEARTKIGTVIGASSGPRDPHLIARLTKAGAAKAQAMSLQKTLMLSDLARHHAPIVGALQRLTANDTEGSLNSLAKVAPADWVDMAYQHGTPTSGIVSANEYANILETGVESLHPTATLVARLRDETISLVDRDFDGVADFLEANPDIDIAKADIDAIAAPRGLKAQPALKRGLQRLQRIRTLSATWREGAALINAQVDSPSTILSLDPSEFAKTMRGQIPKERTDAIYTNARALHDISLALMAYGTPRMAGTPIAAMPAGAPPDSRKLKNHPTLRRMFGDMDYCQCRSCQSVLSPSAYLVDLLEFLRKPRSEQAFLALALRRPDLQDIELSCENAKTELPQIDLALEILENAVALPLKIEPPAGIDVEAALVSSTDTGAPLPGFMLDALRLTAINVNGRLAVAYTGNFFDWVVSDRRRRWVVTNQRPTLWIRKTDELRLSRAAALRLAQIASAVAELDQKTFPLSLRAEIGALFAAELGIPKKGVAFDYVVDVLKPGERWKVSGTLDTRVEIGRNRQPTLTLTANGVRTLSRAYSEPALDATRTALIRGEVGGILGAILPRGGELTVKAQPEPDTWTISSDPISVELVFQPALLTIKSLAYQSSSLDIDLRAAPENRSPKAYQVLGDAVFPWSLPFDLPLTETRATLELLRTSRSELIALLNPDAYLGEEALAAEVLACSPREFGLIKKRATGQDLWDKWGLKVSNGRATLLDTSVDEEISGTPLELLARMSLLLQQARLSPSELLDFLGTGFVTSAAAGSIEIQPLDACAPSALTLQGLTSSHLDRIHRCVRLWRALGWPVHVVDLALRRFSPNGVIDAAALRSVAHLQLGT